MTDQQTQPLTEQKLHGIKVLRMVCRTMLEAVAAGGSTGAPAGVMYSALMGKISLGQFNDIMGALEDSGMLTKTGQVYFLTAKGAAFKP